MTSMTQALFRLDGAVAFVSGAAGHLGQPMVRALAGAGAHVILNGRNPDRLASFAAELSGEGLSCETAAFDMADIAAVRSYFSALPRLDVLVNNAIAMTPKPFAALEPSDFDITYRSSVTAAFEAVRAALAALRVAVAATGEARIVNIASMYGAVAPDKRIYAKPEQASPFHYGQPLSLRPGQSGAVATHPPSGRRIGARAYSRQRAGAGAFPASASFAG